MRIVVYYEDQAVHGDIQEFQPHNLVCGCVETVVNAAAHCLDWDPPPPLEKDINVRDRVLKRAAFARSRAPRDCVLNTVPSLAVAVEFLATRLAAALA